MENLDELLNEKYKLLTEVLSLCNNVNYSKDTEENVVEFTKLYSSRNEIFKKISIIDSKIIAITGDETLVKNDKIREVIKKIVAFDKNYRKSEDEFKIFLNKKIRDAKNTIRLNQRFNQVNYEDISNFNIQG